MFISAKKPRAPKGAFKLAEAFPAGVVMTDLFKKQWVLGKSIGSGGFGLLYLGKLYLLQQHIMLKRLHQIQQEQKY